MCPVYRGVLNKIRGSTVFRYPHCRVTLYMGFHCTSSLLQEAEMTTSSEEGIMFHTQRTISNASTISPDMDDEEEDFQDDPNGEEGPSFRLGSLSKVRT